MGIDVKQLFEKIEDLLIKTLISLEPSQMVGCSKKKFFRNHFFQLTSFFLRLFPFIFLTENNQNSHISP